MRKRAKNGDGLNALFESGEGKGPKQLRRP